MLVDTVFPRRVTEGPLLVVPCFNEAERLRPAELLRLVQQTGAVLILVNDGSSDGTADVLAGVRDGAPRGTVVVLDLDRNVGKAEATRRGLLEALSYHPPILGYFDADLSTPVEELARLIEKTRESEAQVVMGSRVALVGKRIERSYVRHLLGRVFATLASVSLNLVVYDTQCGAKLFRNTATLERAIGVPFRSDWAFDVELLGRLLYPADPALTALEEHQIVEVPLEIWQHQTGSKLRLQNMLKAALDVTVVGAEIRRRASWLASPLRHKSVW